MWRPPSRRLGASLERPADGVQGRFSPFSTRFKDIFDVFSLIFAVIGHLEDVLALSRIGIDGVSLQEASWQRPDPHEGVGDVNAMQHESVNKIWTGDNGGILRCWDVRRPKERHIYMMHI